MIFWHNYVSNNSYFRSAYIPCSYADEFRTEWAYQHTNSTKAPEGKTIDPNSTFVPQFGCYFTKKASQETVTMGPCSPCVCMQICNIESDECLYVHQHSANDPQEPANKVSELFQAEPKLDVTVFTRTNEDEFQKWRFGEKGHKERVFALADDLSAKFKVQKEIVYYNKTINAGNYCDDRSVAFINKEPYRLDPFQSGLIKPSHRDTLYEELKLKKKFGDRIDSTQRGSIWHGFDVPLYQIKKPNLQKINRLPSSNADPLSKYFHRSYTSEKMLLCATVGLLLGFIVGSSAQSRGNKKSP